MKFLLIDDAIIMRDNLSTAVRRRDACILAVSLATAPALRTAAAEPSRLFSETFTSQKLGLDLGDADGRVQILKVKQGSEAFGRGVPPLVYLDGINGEPLAKGVTTAEDAQTLIRQSPRPLTLRFDRGEAYEGLSPDAIVEKAAQASGMETARVTITKSNFLGSNCGFKTRVGDFIEFDYVGTLKSNGAEFDSTGTAGRGRPFAAPLGNGEMVKGLELGLFEMCIGEQRTIDVPPLLGFGTRGSRSYGVPPDATLRYEVKLVSINGQTDPATKREDMPDEQRYMDPY